MPPVQRKATGDAEPGADASAVAAEATRGPGGGLPHQGQIQAAFGRHDVSSIRAFQGGEAHGATQTLGARAFAYGDAVAFSGAPDLHTAAHEAAHVVQQRGGVQLKGNIDQPGDVHGRHADAVADRVVAGQPAEALLDQVAGGSGARLVVQRKPDDKPPAKDDIPQLPDGMNLQIQSDGAVVVRAAWVESAPDKSVSANGVQSPSVISAILRALKDAGVLYWMPDAKVWGTTPADFKRMTYEERVKFLASDKQRLKDMIAAHTNAKGEPTDARWADMVSYAKDKLKTLDETEQTLGKENTAGNVFFEARGTFLSRKNGIPDKALKLLGSANKDGADIKTIVHDFTQLYEPNDYTFSATGTTFEKSVEATFVSLAKSYPPGRISCLFEALGDSLAPSQKTVGFEFDTGTAWKDVKSVVYNPTVMMVVNIVGAATMVFLPVTAPVLFPMLATYNSIETIDNMAQLQAKGNLTWGNVAKGVAQIGLNFLPYVGELKVVANMGKVAMYTPGRFALDEDQRSGRRQMGQRSAGPAIARRAAAARPDDQRQERRRDLRHVRR